jgi:hypothetical protein
MSIARRTRRPVSGTRFARTLRRLRWPVMIAWLIAVIFLFPLASSLSHVARASLRPTPRLWCSPAARA